MQCLCSVWHCSWCSKTFTGMPGTQLSFCPSPFKCISLSPAPDESPTILTVTPHTTTSVLICWQVSGWDFSLTAAPVMLFHQRFVITEQEGIVCILNTYYQTHPWITLSKRAGFKSHRPLVHIFIRSGEKGEWTGSSCRTSSFTLYWGIFLICLLNLSLELAKVWFIQSKDVLPLAISNVHVYTISNYMYSMWLNPRHKSNGKSLKGAGLHFFWPIAGAILFAESDISGTDIPHFTFNDNVDYVWWHSLSMSCRS